LLRAQPDNVMMDKSGAQLKMVLTDLDCACRAGEALPQAGKMKVTVLCTSPEYLRRCEGVRRPAGTSLQATSAVAEVAAASADVFCMGIMLARIFAGGARPFNTEQEVRVEGVCLCVCVCLLGGVKARVRVRVR
jgi:hypothetical protein